MGWTTRKKITFRSCSSYHSALVPTISCVLHLCPPLACWKLFFLQSDGNFFFWPYTMSANWMYTYYPTSPESSRGVARQWSIIASAQKQTRQQLRVRAAAACQLPLQRRNIKLSKQGGESLTGGSKTDQFYSSPKEPKIRHDFKFHLTPNTHKMLSAIVHCNKPIYKSKVSANI